MPGFREGVNCGDGETQSYTFDAMGNRATKSDTVSGSGTTAESYSCDTANRLTSKTVGSTTHSVTSDANGNVRNDNNGDNRWNDWDSQNRLVKAYAYHSDGTSSATTFTYGADGLRRRGIVTDYGVYSSGGGHTDLFRVDGTPPQGAATGSTQTDYVYDGTMMVEEIIRHFDGSGTALDTPVTISYLQGPCGPLYRKSSAATDPTWYVYDGLGSVVGEIDVTGALTATKQFDVYGATRALGGTPTTRQGFVGGLGHETDDETGLVYMQARYYDPSTGRFISEDGARQGSDWFIYCSDDPVNYCDATGKAQIKPIPGTRWSYRLERDLGDDTWHVHLLDKKGNDMGAYWKEPKDPSAPWKHGPEGSIPGGVEDGMSALGHPLPAMDSVSAGLENDPLGTVAILLDVGGDHDDAAIIDRINS